MGEGPLPRFFWITGSKKQPEKTAQWFMDEYPISQVVIASAVLSSVFGLTLYVALEVYLRGAADSLYGIPNTSFPAALPLWITVPGEHTSRRFWIASFLQKRTLHPGQRPSPVPTCAPSAPEQ